MGAPRVTTFVGGSPDPISVVAPDAADDDEGAPPQMPMPKGRARAAHPLGEAASPDPDEVAAGRSAPPTRRRPSSAASVMSTDTVGIRLKCLEMAAASGARDPIKVMEIARTYLGFIQGE